MSELHPEPPARARDAGLVRLKHATRAVLFGATALVGAVAGLAAHSFPGHKARAAVVTTRTVRQVTPAQHVTTTTAAPPPVVTTVAPVAVSGAT
jgi:uncharacterized membrane protein